MRLQAYRSLLIFAMLFLAVRNADAQAGAISSSSTVVVRVQAPDGGPFEEPAEVELSSTREPTPFRKITRASGEAEFENINTGTYSVVVTARGYKSGRESVEVTGLAGDIEVW